MTALDHSGYLTDMPFRLLLLLFSLGALAGCAELDEILAADSGPEVVYVRETSHPAVYDPYYYQPKVYVVRSPEYYESTKTKTKNGRVYKTTTIKDEFGDTVYKHTSSKKKKK